MEVVVLDRRRSIQFEAGRALLLRVWVGGCLVLAVVAAGVWGDDVAATRTDPSAVAGAAVEHPLRGAIRFAQSSLEAMEGIRDYECLMRKRERLGGELQTQVMRMRFREEPFSVYFKFGEPTPGREVLYVAGRNDNKLLAHEGTGVKSYFGTVSLALDSPQVLESSRHRITDAGLKNTLKKLIAQWEQEAAYGEIDVRYYPDAKLGEIACRVVEVSHPRPRNQFPFHISRLYLNARTNLPVRVENYSWPRQAGEPPVLVEEYTYIEMKTNVGFDDRHFDPKFEEYNF
ncbi:MAG: DUF1571 domain-containing protein [Planctomycetaceae bacterium]